MNKRTDILLAALLIGLLSTQAGTAIAQESEASWTDKFSMSGDVRVRWEGIYQDERNDREQGRFRGRFGFTAAASDNVKVIFRLATGNGNPVSTNLSFGDGFSLKNIFVDRAYVDWKINDKASLYAGKMKNPWFRAGKNTLQWDDDLNPEGVAGSFQSGIFFGNLAWMVVDEDSGKNDTFLYTAQAGTAFNLVDNRRLTAGIGYYDYTNVAGKVPFFNERAKGNSVDAEGNYLYDFTIVEAFAEYKTEIGGLPLIFFGQWLRNTDVDEEETAYAFGAKLGSASQRGRYQISYAYHDTGADAVIGTFSDSDFAGGNTDSNGHYVKAKYAIRDGISLAGTFIVARLEEFAGTERDYNRIMLDIEFMF